MQRDIILKENVRKNLAAHAHYLNGYVAFLPAELLL